MVVRTFTVEEMVQLPRMSASDTIALATSLRTRALAAPVLPPAISRPLQIMVDELGILFTLAESRIPDSAPNDSRELADRILNAAWAALRSWCKGWSLLPYPEHAAQSDAARDLEARIFPDGLRFTQASFRIQWVESQARIGLIDREGLVAVVTTLGGAPFLDAVRKAHDEFGRVLGITEVPDDQEGAVYVRDAMDRLISSMRRYVLQVTAYADSGEPDSEALADALLMPIKTWKTRPTSTAPSDDAPVTGPVTEPAPTPPDAALAPTPPAAALAPVSAE